MKKTKNLRGNFCLFSLIFIFSISSSYADYWSDRKESLEGFVKDPKGTTEKELGKLAPKAKDLWGRAGKVAMPAAEKIMKGRNQKKEPLTDRMKYALRPIFGDLVDRINVRYNSKMLDKWSALGYEINLSGVDTVGQAYGYDIFIAYPKSRFNSEPADMLHLLIHEITHVQQMRDIKNTVADFGYRYFWEYKVANLNYEKNELEIKAEANANSNFQDSLARYNRYEDYIKLQAKHSGMCWHIKGASYQQRSPVWTWSCNPSQDEHFKFIKIPTEGGYFKLQDRNSALCLHVKGADKNKRAPLWTWSCEQSNADHFKFKKIPVSGEYFMLQAKHSGMCLHVKGASQKSRSPIWTWPCPTTATEHFLFREIK